MASKLTKTTTDHEEIRRWAEERGAAPAEVERTEREGETGVIRLDFPGYSGAGSLKQISWDEWFEKFDESGLALVYQDRTAQGQKSNFNKLIARETADARAHGEDKASRRTLRGRGRTAARRSAGGARSGRASGGTREAPRAVAARLTGRDKVSEAAGTRRSPPSRGTSRKGGGRGAKTTGRSTAKGGRSTSKRAGRSSRRSRR